MKVHLEQPMSLAASWPAARRSAVLLAPRASRETRMIAALERLTGGHDAAIPSSALGHTAMIRRRPLASDPQPSSIRCYLAACSAGHRPFAAKVDTSNAFAATGCPSCQSAAVLIPGAYYPEEYLSTLERVIAHVADAELPSRVAQLAVARLERLVAQPSREAVRGVLSDFSALAPLVVLLPKSLGFEDTQGLRRFIGALTTLLSFHAERGSYLRAAPESSNLWDSGLFERQRP
jgi:hypothetical protein